MPRGAPFGRINMTKGTPYGKRSVLKVKSIFLSTRGENDNEVPRELVKFLEFVKADQDESESDFEDDFVKKLQESIRRIKGSWEMEERFMIFEEMLREERAEGKAEDVLEVLEDLGEIPEHVRERIMNEKDLQTLTKWLRLAAKADSFEEFLKTYLNIKNHVYERLL